MLKSSKTLLPLFWLLASCADTDEPSDDESATESESTAQDSDEETTSSTDSTSTSNDDSSASSTSSTSSADTSETPSGDETATSDDESESTSDDSQTETTTSSASDDSSSDETATSGTLRGEVVRYDLHFSLASLALHSELAIKAEAPGGDYFAAPCEPEASDVLWNGSMPISIDQVDDELLVCGPALTTGAKFSIAARTQVEKKTYLVDPQGRPLDVGYTEKANLSGETTPYLMSWIGGCKHFAPCDAEPARLADFHYEIEHEPGMLVLCPGKLTPGETLTRCDLDSTQGMAQAPTYTGFMVIGDANWTRRPLATAAGVDLVLYEGEAGGIQDVLDEDLLVGYFEWITDLIGDYPYGDELRFAAAPTVWLGLEHPANIVLQEKLDQVAGAFADTPMHVVMHEVAHQWSGNRTTLASAQDFAWKEASAEYLTYLFEESNSAPGVADRTREFWEQLAINAKHYPRPTDVPELEPQEFYGDAYGAGPLVMFIQLEALLGRETVIEALQNFLAEAGTRSVADLRDELEKASDEDLEAYFDAWVFGKGAPTWPTFAVETTPMGVGSLEVKVTQASGDGVLRGCVVEVEVETSLGTERALINFGTDPSSATASTVIDLDGVVLQTTVDPDHRLLNADSTFSSAPIENPSRFIGY